MQDNARKERLGWYVSADWWELRLVVGVGEGRKVPRQNFLQGRSDLMLQQTLSGSLMQDDDDRSEQEITNLKRNECGLHTY